MESVQSFLKIQAHPVTEVYCTALGHIALKRYDAEPLTLNPTSCSESRKAILRRVQSLLESLIHEDRSRPEYKMPISDSGLGLTLKELEKQTIEACTKSKQIEQQRQQAAITKAKKYKLKTAAIV
jgi:hypothetical protein